MDRELKRKVRALRKLKRQTQKKTKARRDINRQIRKLKEENTKNSEPLTAEKQALIDKILSTKREYYTDLSLHTTEELKKHIIYLKKKGLYNETI